MFLLSNLVTDPSFMSISLPVMELWQFLFIRDWLENRKLKIHLSKFRPISGDWGKLGMQNLAGISLMKCYWMLENARFTWIIKRKPTGRREGGEVKDAPTQIGVKLNLNLNNFFWWKKYENEKNRKLNKKSFNKKLWVKPTNTIHKKFKH